MNRFSRKVAAILIGVIFLGEIRSSMAMNEKVYEGDNSLSFIDCDILELQNALRGETIRLIPCTSQVLKVCKEKNKKLFKISSNGGWLIVNNDLSPFRAGFEDEQLQEENFYYFMDENNLARFIDSHPLKLNYHNEIIYKLPIAGNKSFSLIVCYAPRWHGSGVKTVDKNGTWTTKLLSKDKENYENEYIRPGIDVGEATLEDLEAFRLEQSDDDSKTYLFPTKNLIFLEDIRNKGEEDEEETGVKEWFEKNKEEIESYANKKRN